MKTEDLKKIFPRAEEFILQGLLDNLDLFGKYEVNIKDRMAMCLAQLAHESDGFHTTEEYASGASYEGREDLGNVEPGDGRKYKGRGLIQLTGRNNYKVFGELLGIDIENDPELVEEFPLALEVSLMFWKKTGCNKLADEGDFTLITKRINGGYNGMESRLLYLKKVREKLIPLLTI